MSLLISIARSSALHRQAFLRSRSIHTTSPLRSDHDHYHHLPFQWPGEKKTVFALKVVGFLSAGFALPFIATKWQLNKSQSGA